MKNIKLTGNAQLAGGFYRLPTEDGKPSVNVLEGAWYEAAAIDEDGNAYTVFWTLRPGYDTETGDESDACDWEHPVAVVSADDCARDVTAMVGAVQM